MSFIIQIEKSEHYPSADRAYILSDRFGNPMIFNTTREAEDYMTYGADTVGMNYTIKPYSRKIVSFLPPTPRELLRDMFHSRRRGEW